MGALSNIIGDSVVIELGGQAVELRPTLRAAIKIHGMGGFENVLRKVQELDTRTIRRVIRGATSQGAAKLVEKETPGTFLAQQAKLLDYIMILANGGAVPKLTDIENDEAPPRAREAFDDYFAHLFKVGTGWLGWTPEETLNATMPAIVSAYVGRQEFLQAIFGGGGKRGRNDIPLDEKIRAGFAFLGTTKVKRIRPA